MSINVPPPYAYPPPPPINTGVRVGFVSEGRDFRRIAIRGALLEFVTFGFYRFWLATRLRRHLWSNTLVAGEPFEYTGTAKELFIGFLFSLAILAPIYFVYFLVGVEAERLKAFASTPLFLFLFAFGQFALYRARRYRLTRTVWRGIRFWMDGSGFGYAWRACLWSFLVYLTLGLALPWREAALERYKMRHTYYGDLQGEFVGTGWEFFKRGWWLWLLGWLPVLVVVGLSIAAWAFRAATGHHSGQSVETMVAILVVGAMLDDEIVRPQLFAEPRERQHLILELRHQHHLQADGDRQVVLLLDLHHVADVLADAVEPMLLDPHDLGVTLALPGRDVDTQIGEMGQHLLQLVTGQHEAIGAHRHRHAELRSAPDRMDEDRRPSPLRRGWIFLVRRSRQRSLQGPWLMGVSPRS